MEPIKQFKMGTSYFFDRYEDYVMKDYDDLCIMDTFPFTENVMNMKLKERDVFMFRNMDKQGFIDDLTESGVYMKAGKFLIPEFNEYIGFTIDDLKSIMYCFDRMDTRHTYEKQIAEFYIQNNGFYLTDEQRDSAYSTYKMYRRDK